MKSLAKFGSILGVICLAATALLATMNSVTAGRIRMQSEAELKDSLKEVMPGGVQFEPVDISGQTLYYKVTGADGRRIGAAFKASAKGYSSTIETIVGMNADGSINAIKVISQQETPGLGSRITEIADSFSLFDLLRGKRRPEAGRPWFQEQFNGKSVADLNGIQAITGATISSRAVIESVKQKAAHIQTILQNG